MTKTITITQTFVVNIYLPFPCPEIGIIKPETNILVINVEAGDAVRERVSMTSVLPKY